MALLSLSKKAKFSFRNLLKIESIVCELYYIMIRNMREVYKFKKNIVKKIKNVFDMILDVFFPRNCIGCEKPHIALCNQCMSNCAHSHELKLKWTEAIFSYKDPLIRRALWNIKYRGDTTAIDVLAEALYDTIVANIYEDCLPGFSKTYLIIPIPMTHKSLRERGYNQSELLARAICKKDGEKIFELETKLLLKNKETKNQMSIKNRAERLNNIKRCFFVKNNFDIKGKEIILIDDIVTTGATLNEARRALLFAGAKNVTAFAIAH